ncbi:MAG: nickel pincer cofactor biosynthesis protein LarB [Calditrichaeota bacterium]|nr:MAG: nickel pincer cofactor biosynthesis protein LarB [Calditrichota bacterium]MBL1205985.1 nickel pincer cofactor biosynthesis protein LarB [Calditrichota bacterium]NOG45813.1 nickel pincer cofactor biosynthesis protein LarB [Calditrichota bacterium]
MKEKNIKDLLELVKEKKISIEEAVSQLKQGPFQQKSNSFFMPDHHRSLRNGLGEVVYAESKKTKHLLTIADEFNKRQDPILFTRLKKKQFAALNEAFPDERGNDLGRTFILHSPPEKHSSPNEPFIAIVAAGTSDLPVVEEAAETCIAMNTAFEKVVDVGVAGLHRVLHKLDVLQKATAVIVIAGMEGALPSVVGGLVDCPVFAVPTSVGYGASFKGVSALLGMLNSCAPGVTVANIDNGFSAAFAACQVVRMVEKTSEKNISKL